MNGKRALTLDNQMLNYYEPDRKKKNSKKQHIKTFVIKFFLCALEVTSLLEMAEPKTVKVYKKHPTILKPQ